MYRTQWNIALVTYLIGVCGFTYYDALARANWSVLSAVGYGVKWPLSVLTMF